MPSTKRTIEEVSSSVPQRVVFNVGGKHYEISRSLLEQHNTSMLARMASKTWNDDLGYDDESRPPLFVERDSNRFAFVLDYMRDGKVMLPLSIPRASFVQDMEFFGLDFSDENVGIAVLPGLETRLVADEVHRKSHEAKKRASEIEAQLMELERKRFCEEVAIKCYQEYAGARLKPNELYTIDGCSIRLAAVLPAKHFVGPVNDILGPVYGLKCTELCFSHGALQRTNTIVFKIGHYTLRESEHRAVIKVHVELSALNENNSLAHQDEAAAAATDTP